MRAQRRKIFFFFFFFFLGARPLVQHKSFFFFCTWRSPFLLTLSCRVISFSSLVSFPFSLIFFFSLMAIKCATLLHLLFLSVTLCISLYAFIFFSSLMSFPFSLYLFYLSCRFVFFLHWDEEKKTLRCSRSGNVRRVTQKKNWDFILKFCMCMCELGMFVCKYGMDRRYIWSISSGLVSTSRKTDALKERQCAPLLTQES